MANRYVIVPHLMAKYQDTTVVDYVDTYGHMCKPTAVHELVLYLINYQVRDHI